MPGNEDSPVVLTARCLCKAHIFTAEVERSGLPLEATCCHCNSCRHTTGALYTCGALWPGDREEIQKSTVHKYAFTENLTYHFCGTCGSLMFYMYRDGRLGVFTGVLDNIDVPGLVQIRNHMFLGDTLDGGASPWLRWPNKDDVPARLWKGETGKSEELSRDWPPIISLPNAATKAKVSQIPIRCHCKGVDFVLHDGSKDFEGKPPPELPWFIDPVTHKGIGGFDPCDSCRLSSGVDHFYWTFVLPKYITFPVESSAGKSIEFPPIGSDLKPLVSVEDEDRDPRFGTLAFYESSPGIQRYFCSRCSACVFYACSERPEIDVAVGVLESPDGARAEGLLSWAFGGNMTHRQDQFGGWREDLLLAIEAAGEAWRIERSYPKNWRRAAREAAESKKSG